MVPLRNRIFCTLWDPPAAWPRGWRCCRKLGLVAGPWGASWEVGRRGPEAVLRSHESGGHPGWCSTESVATPGIQRSPPVRASHARLFHVTQHHHGTVAPLGLEKPRPESPAVGLRRGLCGQRCVQPTPHKHSESDPAHVRKLVLEKQPIWEPTKESKCQEAPRHCDL